MVQAPRIQVSRLAAMAGTVLSVVLASDRVPLWAQSPPVHYLHAGIMPPGAIGARHLQRGGPLPGYLQPVEIKAPSGTLISPACDGRFDRPSESSLKLGLSVAAVYRLRVTDIFDHPGEEVFPTIEVIDRTYPPVGQELRFPIPIELTQEELEMALAGQFVTRVIYVEDPQLALPSAQVGDEQIVIEAAASDDPLAVADRLGRPVAILRLGGRLPGESGVDQQFLYGSPGYMRYTAAIKVDPARSQQRKRRTALRQPGEDALQPAANAPPAAPAPGESFSSRGPWPSGVRTVSASEPVVGKSLRGPRASEIEVVQPKPARSRFQVFTLPSVPSDEP